MARCRSWRPTDAGLVAAEAGSPGSSRALWRRCRARVPSGHVRCAQCAERLARCADPHVRRLLAAEEALPRQILEELLVDPDFLVSEMATEQAEAAGIDTEHDTAYEPVTHGPAAKTKDDDW